MLLLQNASSLANGESVMEMPVTEAGVVQIPSTYDSLHWVTLVHMLLLHFKVLTSGGFMEIGTCISALKFKACGIFGTSLPNSYMLPLHSANLFMKPLVIDARANTRTESAKIQNRRFRKKFNGTPTKPRLSVFCSDKQLYAILVDDQNKKCLFHGSTLQKSIRKDPSCTTVEAAELVGEELIKTCLDLEINEISSYDRNGLARGKRMQAFEIAIARHGFLLR